MEKTAQQIKAEIEQCVKEHAEINKRIAEGRYQDWDNKTARRLEDHINDLEWQLEQIKKPPQKA